MSLADANWQQDRKACLECLAAVCRDPSQFGLAADLEIIRPSGFNLQTAQFDPTALKRPKDSASRPKGQFVLGSGHVSNPFQSS